MSMPPASSTSNMLSRLSESEPLRPTSGVSSWMSGSAAHWNFGARACAQARLPLMVLISPLWARKRKGWQSRHFGMVLVEKRSWKTQIELSMSGAARSG